MLNKSIYLTDIDIKQNTIDSNKTKEIGTYYMRPCLFQ